MDSVRFLKRQEGMEARPMSLRKEETVHILLKPGLEKFEHYFTSV